MVDTASRNRARRKTTLGAAKAADSDSEAGEPEGSEEWAGVEYKEPWER